MPTNYARDLREVINETLRLVNDYQGDGKNGKTWAWTEVRKEAQSLLLDLVRKTGILKNTQVIPLLKDQQVYDLPPDCIRLLRVNIHGYGGWVLLPREASEYDLMGSPQDESGDPGNFFRDILPPGQIGVNPIPNRDGSTFTRDSTTGLLREIRDADGNTIDFDANRPLRRIKGVPFTRSGTGRLIREVISPYGNLQVTYVRAPAKWEKPNSYPDADIPEYIHKDLKYGVAARVLAGSRKPLHLLKRKRFLMKWQAVERNLQRRTEHKGPMAGAYPI